MGKIHNQASSQLTPFGFTNGYTADADATDVSPTNILLRGAYFLNTNGVGALITTPVFVLADIDRIRFNAAAAILVLDTKIDEILAKANLVC